MNTTATKIDGNGASIVRSMKLILCLALVAGCAAYTPIDTKAFVIGMSKSEVYAAAGDRGKPIGGKQYEHGYVEVVAVSRLSAWDSKVAEEYWLYFLDDELQKWGRPGDWKREADLVYEIRYR